MSSPFLIYLSRMSCPQIKITFPKNKTSKHLIHWKFSGVSRKFSPYFVYSMKKTLISSSAHFRMTEMEWSLCKFEELFAKIYVQQIPKFVFNLLFCFRQPVEVYEYMYVPTETSIVDPNFYRFLITHTIPNVIQPQMSKIEVNI